MMMSPKKLREQADRIEHYRLSKRKWRRPHMYFKESLVTSREHLAALAKNGNYVCVGPCQPIHAAWVMNNMRLDTMIKGTEISLAVRNPNYPYKFKAVLNNPTVSQTEWHVTSEELNCPSEVAEGIDAAMGYCRACVAIGQTFSLTIVSEPTKL